MKALWGTLCGAAIKKTNLSALLVGRLKELQSHLLATPASSQLSSGPKTSLMCVEATFQPGHLASFLPDPPVRHFRWLHIFSSLLLQLILQQQRHHLQQLFKGRISQPSSLSRYPPKKQRLRFLLKLIEITAACSQPERSTESGKEAYHSEITSLQDLFYAHLKSAKSETWSNNKVL